MIPYEIIMPSFGAIRCQESGLNIVGIPSTGFFAKNWLRFWNLNLILSTWDLPLLSNIMWKLENVVAGFSWDTARSLNVGGDYGKKYNSLSREVYWYAYRNGINNFYVKLTERSSIDLPMTLRLLIKIEPHNLGFRGLLVTDRKRTDNFNVKVIGMLSIDLQVTMRLITKIQSYNLGPRGLLLHSSLRNEKFSCQGHRKVTDWPSYYIKWSRISFYYNLNL